MSFYLFFVENDFCPLLLSNWVIIIEVARVFYEHHSDMLQGDPESRWRRDKNLFPFVVPFKTKWSELLRKASNKVKLKLATIYYPQEISVLFSKRIRKRDKFLYKTSSDKAPFFEGYVGEFCYWNACFVLRLSQGQNIQHHSLGW